MHSSRMRTSRSSTVCWSLLPGGEVSGWSGGCLPGPGGVLSQGGLPGPGGGLVPGGLHGPGGVWYPSMHWGMPPPHIPACTEADPLRPMNRMTDRCKNITSATTSLRPVIRIKIFYFFQLVLKTRPSVISQYLTISRIKLFYRLILTT